MRWSTHFNSNAVPANAISAGAPSRNLEGGQRHIILSRTGDGLLLQSSLRCAASIGKRHALCIFPKLSSNRQASMGLVPLDCQRRCWLKSGTQNFTDKERFDFAKEIGAEAWLQRKAAGASAPGVLTPDTRDAASSCKLLPSMQLASMRLPTIRVVVARTTEFYPTMHQPKGLDSLPIVAALMVQSQARTTRRLSILFAIFVTPQRREREPIWPLPKESQARTCQQCCHSHQAMPHPIVRPLALTCRQSKIQHNKL